MFLLSTVLLMQVNSLSTIGGENTKETVRRILTYLFTNKLTTTINRIGKGGKIAFSSLKVKNVVSSKFMH